MARNVFDKFPNAIFPTMDIKFFWDVTSHPVHLVAEEASVIPLSRPVPRV
jgi:hypothetical protein